MPLRPARIVVTLSMCTVLSCAESPTTASTDAPIAVALAPGPHAAWTFEVSARIRDASRAFHPDDGGYRAEIVERDLSARFDASGAHLSVGDDAITVSTVGWGRDARTEAARSTLPALGACIEGLVDPAGDCIRRLEYADAGRTEWWSAGEEGFEQGWTVDTRVPGTGDLAIDLAVTGATVSPGEGDLWLHGNAGDDVLVSGLAAWDADGTALATRFEPTEGGFRIRVTDAGARYPITIDPVYTTPAWTVDGLEGDDFGDAVAGAGDVNKDGYADVIVGAPSYDSSMGRAYVFHGSAAGLSTLATTMLTGEARGNDFGLAVAGDVDVNGDGYDDVVVGAHGNTSYRGRVYVYLGSALGVSSAAIATFSGAADSDYLGRSVSGAGDVNNDGYDDIVAGAGGYWSLTGRAYVFHGSATGMGSVAASALTGESTSSYFAWSGSVSGAGDVNNDGYDDVIVGSAGYDAFAGRVYVFHGSATGVSSAAATTWTGAASDGLGGAVSRAGDVDNDGYDDVIVGARGYGSFMGRAYVHHGSATGVSTTASRTLTGTAANDRFGDVLASAGDLNDDGYGDLHVGAQGYDFYRGRVYTFLGSASGIPGTASTTVTGVAPYYNFASISRAGDVDNDGYDDVIIGGMESEAHLYRGSTSGMSSTAATTLLGMPWSEYFGVSVSGAGDVDNDGYDDVIVGANYYDAQTGRAYLFHGSATGLPTTANRSLDGAAEGDAFGSSVSDAGDVDNDGYDDVIVGACGSTTRAYVFHGSATGVSATVRTTLDDGATGCVSSGAGDVNNDGFSDVIVGNASTLTAKVYLGSATGVSTAVASTLTGSGSFGGAVSDAGDVDNDGYDDVIVGSDGQAHIFHGTSSGVSTTATTKTYMAADDDVFRNVSSAGDVDNDGYDDVIVGATSLRYATYGSRMFIYHGSATGISTAATTTIAGGDLLYGRSVSSAGDVDNDGYDDVIVGAPGAYGAPGSAYVYVGSATGLSTTAVSTLGGAGSDGDDYGSTVSGAGDVDGDGFDDVIIGARSENSTGGRAYLYRGYGAATATDVDGDGHDSPADCNDADAAIHPGAAEVVADGIDQDCDLVDSCYTDGDADGYGTSAIVDGSSLSCATGTGAAVATDCDDTNAARNPGKTEVCDAGSVDEDCDGLADDADSSVDPSTKTVTSYADADGDGYGTGVAAMTCDAATGSTVGTDCADTNAAVHPGAVETCNTLDDDCDALIDDADPGVTGTSTWYTDGDGDGHGVLGGEVTACEAPLGAVASSDDCIDTDATIYPGAAEACNAVDDDCDGTIDDDAGLTWFADADGDTFGDPASSVVDCTSPTGHVADASDCDDTDATVNPAAEETDGDEIDADCDGAESCYVDADDDGYRVDDETVASEDTLCDGVGEATSEDLVGDCDDADVAYHPGAAETDCTDPNDYNCDGSSGMADADDDGFPACLDCDDGSPAVNPDADELCNAYDDDCDGTIDVGAVDSVVWYADADGDGYTDADVSELECTVPDGFAEASAVEDCDDADGAVFPGATDLPDDGIDQDCDGIDATTGGPDDTDDEVDVGCSCGKGDRSGGLLLAGPLLLALVMRRRRA